MPKYLSKKWLSFLALAFFVFLNAFSNSPILKADDDEPLSLEPVQKGKNKADGALDNSPVPTAAPTAIPTAAPTAAASPTPVPTQAPTPISTPRPIKKVAKGLVRVNGVRFKQAADELEIIIACSGRANGKVETLKNPNRILVRLTHAKLSSPQRTVKIGSGPVLRARLAQKRDEVWAVVDLSRSVPFSGDSSSRGYLLKLAVTGKEEGNSSQTEVPHAGGNAVLPKVDMMFFDKNVLFQGKQYENFPCANFIYDKADAFPLEREFQTTFVFYQGYGAFVGNVRILDPDGGLLDQTKDPFAFNLFNQLTDSFAINTWKVKFAKKGYYKVILTLNGEDAYEHKFYVGHADDKP